MMLSIVHLRARCSALYKPVERLIYQALTIKERQRNMNAKRFISYAALLAGVLILNGRLNAAVESDVVGYATIQTSDGFDMLGCVFKGLDGKSVKLQQILSGDFRNGDMIQIPVESGLGYDFYTYYVVNGVGQWYDSGDNVTDRDVAPGTAFWVKIPNRSVTLTGSVEFGDYTVNLPTGLKMVALPFPVEKRINGEITWNDLADGDSLQIRTADGLYAIYKYYTIGGVGGWYDGTL